jgi:hypothetical protein
MSGAGSRDSIYAHIDRLDTVTDVKGLIACLKPILEQLAYDHVHSESSAIADQESWRAEYSSRLSSETRSDSAARVAAARASSAQSHAPAQRAVPHQVVPPGGAPLRQPARPSSNLDNLPPSLRQIMSGSHASLNERDYTQ